MSCISGLGVEPKYIYTRRSLQLDCRQTKGVVLEQRPRAS